MGNWMTKCDVEEGESLEFLKLDILDFLDIDVLENLNI